MIPSEEEALALHRRHGSKEKVVVHCRTVASVSLVVAEAFQKAGTKVDTEAVLAGALLHDLGRSVTQTVGHGLEGARLLAKEQVEERVVQIVRRHVGAGISSDEAASLGLPDLDYIPRTLEERIVCFADKMVDSNQVRPFSQEVERFVRKGHDVERLLGLKKGLQEELGADPETLVLENIKESH